MTVALCICDRFGMLFNGRRQSRDRNQLADLAAIANGKTVYITPFSEKLFIGFEGNFAVSENPLCENDGIAFIENMHLSEYKNEIDTLIIYRWNERYPADFSIDISPEDIGLKLSSSEDFAGYSHEKITREIWRR